jgi:hypothetical protein
MGKSVRFAGLSLTIAVVFTVFSMGLAAQVSAVTILTESSPTFLGYIDPDGGNEQTQALQINILIAQTAPSGPTLIVDPNPPNGAGTNTYTRTANSCGTCPTTSAVGSEKTDSNDNTGDFGDGFDYLKGKYGNLALVWYVAGLEGEFTIPLNSENPAGGGLSHSVLFGPGTNVAEPSTTLLAGLAFAGLAFFGRKFLPKA